MKSSTRLCLYATLIVFWGGCSQKKNDMDKAHFADTSRTASAFQDDVDFLERYVDVIILHDSAGQGKVAVSAALQGRVMTSTSGGDGSSYGWINRQAFTSGDTSKHMNAYGGEDRIWLGPEGGQFSIYFKKGTAFNLDNWFVPRVIDLDHYEVSSSTANEAVFTKSTELTNYSGKVFNVGLKRTIRIIEKDEAVQKLNLGNEAENVSTVAFESINELKNNGKDAWRKETGLLSVWILGMFNPSPGAVIIIPYQGEKSELRQIVNDSYFGRIPDDRLKLVEKTILFKADGKYRSKIGMLPENAPEYLGSYDSDNGVLTVVKYNKPQNELDYVNSLWEIQKDPYRGDVINAYNDGPPAPGAKPLGPFFELETSSPARELEPGKSITHSHATFHFKGTEEELNPVMKKLFNISIAEAKKAF